MCFSSLFLTFALQPLFCEAVEQGATVVAPRELQEVVNLKPVRHVDLEPGPGVVLGALLDAGAAGDDHLVASLVHHAHTHLALVTLLTKPPGIVEQS